MAGAAHPAVRPPGKPVAPQAFMASRNADAAAPVGRACGWPLPWPPPPPKPPPWPNPAGGVTPCFLRHWLKEALRAGPDELDGRRRWRGAARGAPGRQSRGECDGSQDGQPGHGGETSSETGWSTVPPLTCGGRRPRGMARRAGPAAPAACSQGPAVCDLVAAVQGSWRAPEGGDSGRRSSSAASGWPRPRRRRPPGAARPGRQRRGPARCRR